MYAQKDKFLTMSYRNHEISIFKSISHDNWSLYVDGQYIHNVRCQKESHAFEWLKGYVDSKVKVDK